MKAAVIIGIRLVALTVIYFICFAAVSAALLPVPEQATPDQAGGTLAALLAVSLLNTLVLSYIIIRSRWAGWKLILAVFLVFYGVVTVMGQIETAFFVTRLPPGMLPRLFLSGAIIAALFSALAVLILGKGKSSLYRNHAILTTGNECRPMGRQTIVDCHRLPGHLFHLRLLHRLEKCVSAGLLRRQRSGKLTGPDEECGARNALAAAASSGACTPMDCPGGSGH